MKCQRCAAENPDDAQFCRKCGARVDVIVTPSQPGLQASALPKLLRFVGAVLLSFLGVIFFLAAFFDGGSGSLGGFIIGSGALFVAYMLFKG